MTEGRDQGERQREERGRDRGEILYTVEWGEREREADETHRGIDIRST